MLDLLKIEEEKNMFMYLYLLSRISYFQLDIHFIYLQLINTTERQASRDVRTRLKKMQGQITIYQITSPQFTDHVLQFCPLLREARSSNGPMEQRYKNDYGATLRTF